MQHGVLPDCAIRELLRHDHIRPVTPIGPNQVQPASLDLRLGCEAWRLRASFLPGTGEHVEDRAVVLHRLDLTRGAVLETGCVYLVRLDESLRLPGNLSGRANAKSSIGRLDVFTRLVADGATRFDSVPAGYHGPLYAEVVPRTFPILAHAGDRMIQLRLCAGERRELRIEELHFDADPDGNGFSGYRALRHAGMVDLSSDAPLDPDIYWDKLPVREGRLVLDPGEFYILASCEAVSIGLDEAAELAPIAPELGEFRAHYAGFFDPGFGRTAGASRAVLEVRPHDVPFILEHGQKMARLVHETMAGRSENPYGSGAAAGSYQGQGLRLSRYFRALL